MTICGIAVKELSARDRVSFGIAAQGLGRYAKRPEERAAHAPDAVQ